ncbi:hypothetical protein FWC31_00375 [Candidatus Saccharibacteria bacterium]|nr:hypothetical protein [Candidatus Saccharibacteria bacterium]
MTAQDFIVDKLQALKEPLDLPEFSGGGLEDEIVRLILSKKFRKYAVSEEERAKINNDVHSRVANNESIQIKYVFGGYKLWRLDETPEVDFAELFFLIYCVKWLKPVCGIYPAGVEFELVLDDVIVPIMNNIPPEDLIKYRESLQKLIDFISQFTPKNLQISFKRVGDLYGTHDEFLEDLEKSLAETEMPKKLTAEQIATIELNVCTSRNQKEDAFWREEIQHIHDAYMGISRRRPYYRRDGVFDALASRPPMGRLIIGTTKTSIMKFWVGVGALKPKGDSFDMAILSSNQLANADFNFESVSIDGLSGKNFSKIRVMIDA